MSDLEYYAVIFTSELSGIDSIGYNEMAEKMVELAKNQNGFLGIESARGADNCGITISYWKSINDINAWKINSEHLLAQEHGRNKWYKSFKTRICKVQREKENNNNYRTWTVEK